jgi:hypothetical protein
LDTADGVSAEETPTVGLTDLSGGAWDGAAITSSAVGDAQDPEFTKSTLQGFSAGNPTAIDFGPDGRAYVSTQDGTVYALDVTRNGENDYRVVSEVQIDAIETFPTTTTRGTTIPVRTTTS